MRLIDADALKEKIEQSDGDGAIAKYCKRVLAECLDNDAPTIDAIPVEWMREKMNIADDAGDLDSVDLFSWILQTWQKEQEAR